MDQITFEQIAAEVDGRYDKGPFDIIGDIHGCLDELKELLVQIGYVEIEIGENLWTMSKSYYQHPAGRKAIFLGDFGDRGPKSVGVLELAQLMIHYGSARAVIGNHDNKLLKKLCGHDVRVSRGLECTMSEIENIPESLQQNWLTRTIEFLSSLPGHYVLDEGKLVVAHAGMKAEFQGRDSKEIRNFALYGETNGQVDSDGMPIRLPWAKDYRGQALVVFGHTVVPEPEWLNSTVNIDTGCVFGGKLTALRYPENEIIQVQAKELYWTANNPFLKSKESREANNLL